MHGSGKNSNIWEWVILFGSTAAAVAIAELIGLRQEWEDAIVYTVMIFAAVITAMRPAWGRPAFWQNLLPLFGLHVIGVTVVVQALPVRRFGIPKIMLLPAGIVEGLLLLAVLWKRTVRSKSDQGR